MMAQDTGSAIRGPLRGDFFWGYGEQAGVQAGRMRQSGRMWVLAPLGVAPERLFMR
jgi:membrane-bound lytic murein transglycosylase A